MKKLIMFVLVIFPSLSFASGKEVCVQMSRHESRLCAEIDSIQDSSMDHLASLVSKFRYEDGGGWIPFMRYTAREICREFISAAYPNATNIRPEAPFGLSKEAGTVWVMHSNGNCKGQKTLKSVGCYRDFN